MLSTIEKAHAYLQTHNLEEAFIYNYENADNDYKAKHTTISKSFIIYAFLWRTTNEGYDFWSIHDDGINDLNIAITPIEVYQYIQQQTTQPQSYEYW